MRATDDRYRGEQARFELAMRMISHEARTGTIRYWTGLSDDRIRNLYASYFKHAGRPVRRRRGRSPSQIAPLVRNPQRVLESGVLANLLIANRVLRHAGEPQPKLEQNVLMGHRFCEAFETYVALVSRPMLNFEWSWNLLLSIRRGDELGIARCEACAVCYIIDLLAPPGSQCPGCSVLSEIKSARASARCPRSRPARPRVPSGRSAN
jgi:hypothetical protein